MTLPSHRRPTFGRIPLVTLLAALVFTALSTCTHSGAAQSGNTPASAGHAETAAQPDASAHHGHGAHHDHAARHAAHRFLDPEEWAKEFDDPGRDAWQKPEEVVAALALAPNAKVADIGAGTGYFSVRLARAVPRGKVFAQDIEPSMVRYLGERASREKLTNLVPLLGGTDDAKLPEAVDLVLVVNTYHHITERPAYFTKLRARLAPKGRLAIIDFRRGVKKGPPDEEKIPAEQIQRELEQSGYRLSARHTFLPDQDFLVFDAP